MKKIVKKLTSLNKTIATMESCTGGYIANSITNIEGASDVIKFSAITYSNEYKIKMGVSKDILDKYSVYSMEVANEMSYNIAKFSNANYGIGITGKINKSDKNNPYGMDNLVYISIYDKDMDKYYNDTITCIKETRIKNKKLILDNIIILLNNIIR